MFLPLPLEARGPDEYHVKAAFLYHFTQFIDWPARHFEKPESPFHLCVQAPDPFGAVLDHTVAGKRVAQHPIVVIRIDSITTISPCHILFLGNEVSSSEQVIKASQTHSHIVTIGEQPAFLEDGGMIQFFFQDRKVRFALNLEALRRSDTTVSTKLLRLGKIFTP